MSNYDRLKRGDFDRAPGDADYADETRHGMSHADLHPLLPRPRAAPAAPVDPTLTEAMNGGVGFDHSGIREAIHHVRTLKTELASLGTASVDVKHRGFGSHGGHSPGAVRTALNGNFSSDGRAFS